MEEPQRRAGRLRDHMLLVRLVEELNRAKGRAGSTHIQKLVFFLKYAWAVPTSYDFVIYHYGPYSFSLGDDLMLLRSRGWLQASVGAGGLGVHYAVGKGFLDWLSGNQNGESQDFPAVAGALALVAGSPGAAGEGGLRAAIQEAVQRLGHRSTRDLELLATTFYIAKGLDTAKGRHVAKLDSVRGPHRPADTQGLEASGARFPRDQGSVASMVVRLKPHFTVEDVDRAYQELAAMGFLDG